MTTLQTGLAPGECLQIADRLADCFGDWEELPVPDEFRERSALRGRSLIRTRRARLPRGEARVVTIGGGNAEIFNLLVFPDRPGVDPLLVIELFVSGGVIRVFFLDLPYLGKDAPRREEIRDRVDQSVAPTAGTAVAPEWATRHSPGSYRYLRDGEGADGETIVASIEEAIIAWVRLTGAASPEPDVAHSHQTLAQFKRCHIAESPNLGFLSSVFGADWSTRFMNDFLYR